MRTFGLTDEKLRELYRVALAERGRGGRERCVAPEAMLAVLRREGPEEPRLEALDHVMGCHACRGEFDLLRSIEQAGAEGTRPVLLRFFSRPRWRSLAPLALAASVVLVVAVGQTLRTREAPDIARGTADAVVLLAPAPEVAAGAPVTFAWQPVPGARRYELEVLDGQGKVVFAEATEQTSVTLQDPRRLAPGASYRWWVRATTDSGDQRASPLRALRLPMK